MSVWICTQPLHSLTSSSHSLRVNRDRHRLFLRRRILRLGHLRRLYRHLYHVLQVVGAEDLEAGTYSTSDIVLPLPGSRVIYPSNDIAEVYHDLAKKDGISLTESTHAVKEFSITSMTGGYRRVFQKPIDFEWELLANTDSNKPLAETDLDRITIGKPRDKAEEIELVNSDCNPQDAEQTQMALKMALTLPSSCYATMAIRELLKTSTSVAYHKTLN